MSPYTKTLDIINYYVQKKQYNKVITKCNELFIAYPLRTECLSILVNAYNNINDPKKTIHGLKSLIKQTPPDLITSYCILQNELSIVYVNNNKHNLAIDCFKNIISKKNDIPDIYNNMSICYNVLKDYNKCIVCLNISLKLNKNDCIYRRLGSMLLYVKKYNDSIACYESIKISTPDDLYNKSFPYLASKQYLIGFNLYENRLDSNRICSQTNLMSRLEVPMPYWNGIDSCNHLMIIYEQGIGDNIQYFRFIIELSKLYPHLKITYFCKSNISHLFNVNSYDNISIIDDSIPLDLSKYDKKLYIMSLPYILKLQTITPNPINYIVCDKTNDEIWSQRMLPFANKLKVGFVYSGLLISYIDKQIELNDFKDICCDKNIQSICLHRIDEKIASDISKIDFADEIITDEIDMNKPFTDTISILRNIDVLITIDTSIAHLAAVMGVKTLLLIGYTSEWRWFNNDDKVWYDSVDIIRMTEQKSLSNLMPTVKALLDNEYSLKQTTP